MGSHAQRSIKNVYIFEKDYKALIAFVLDDPKQRSRENLFGLWTTKGEPVIHTISGPLGLSTARDSSGKDCPLSHIGNWHYNEIPGQTDYSRYGHDDRGRFIDLKVRIMENMLKTTYEVKLLANLLGLSKDSPCKIEFLPGESPLKNVHGMEEIASNVPLNGSFDTAEQMKWSPSHVSEDSLSHFIQSPSTLAGNPSLRKYVSCAEVLPSISGKRSGGPCVTGNRRFQSGFASNRDFNVFMFTEDYQMMVRLVLEYPNLETGGDLFGLWTSDGDVVLHAVLGPGRNCKRTVASFYQDVPYLKRNGELLTQDYMLCHIGEWHSHHQLHLFQPSHGDSSTVIRNYPRGAYGFLLIIANILSPSEVKLLPYLYTEKSTYDFDKVGNIAVLPCKNVFNGINKIKEAKEMGREIKQHSQYVFSQSRYNRFQQSPTSPRGVRTTLARSPKVQKHNLGTYKTSMRTQLPWRP